MSTTPDSSFQKQRIAIGLATGENPPWTGQYFACACGAEYQLCASDVCVELPRMEFESRRIETPACWTCGRVNRIPVSSDQTFQEGNPS
jgi:hypothetical protein